MRGVKTLADRIKCWGQSDQHAWRRNAKETEIDVTDKARAGEPYRCSSSP